LPGIGHGQQVLCPSSHVDGPVVGVGVWVDGDRERGTGRDHPVEGGWRGCAFFPRHGDGRALGGRSSGGDGEVKVKAGVAVESAGVKYASDTSSCTYVTRQEVFPVEPTAIMISAHPGLRLYWTHHKPLTKHRRRATRPEPLCIPHSSYKLESCRLAQIERVAIRRRDRSRD
jgi:hypothetical protein